MSTSFRFGQRAALAAYKVIVRSGVLSNAYGQRAWAFAYLAYKRWFEAGEVAALRSFVPPGTTVIDVGANIGFFALQFAEWAGREGRVLAIEPEDRNIRLLRHRAAQHGCLDRVEIIEAAADEKDGPLLLAVNEIHPGDHRVSEQGGIPISGRSIDEIIDERSLPPVSLIKIDVQGAEMRVLRGARRTLVRDRPYLFVEIDDAALTKSGSSTREVSEFFSSLGYECLVHRGEWVRIDSLADDEPRRLQRGYCDYLFQPAAGG